MHCGTCRKLFNVIENFVVQDGSGRYKPIGEVDPAGTQSQSDTGRAVPGGRTGFDRDGSNDPDPRTTRDDRNIANSSGPGEALSGDAQEGRPATDAANRGYPAASALGGAGVERDWPTDAGQEWENTDREIEDGSDEGADAPAESVRSTQDEAGAEQERSSVGAAGDRGGTPDVPAWRDRRIENDRVFGSAPSEVGTGDLTSQGEQGYREMDLDPPMDDHGPAMEPEGPGPAGGSNADVWNPAGPARHVLEETDTESVSDSPKADEASGSTIGSNALWDAADAASRHPTAVPPETGTQNPMVETVRDNPYTEQDRPDGNSDPAWGYGPTDTRHEADTTDDVPADSAMSVLVEGAKEERASSAGTDGGDAGGSVNSAREEATDREERDSIPALPAVDADSPMTQTRRGDRASDEGPSMNDDGPSAPGEGVHESVPEGDDLAELVHPLLPSDGEKMVDLEITPEPAAGNWFNVETDDAVERNPFETVEETASSGKSPSVQSNISMNGVDAYIADRPNPLAGFLWFIVAMGFLFLLGLQVRTYLVDGYAQDERFRPYLSLFCRVASCELPSRRDTYSFSITNTRVELHTDVPGALSISVKLVNQAEFSQPYPDLQLTLIDRVGRVIGRRIFPPDSYLGVDEETLLKSGALVTVDFELAQPNEQAVGFVVEIVLESAA